MRSLDPSHLDALGGRPEIRFAFCCARGRDGALLVGPRLIAHSRHVFRRRIAVWRHLLHFVTVDARLVE